ncbi:periplasmic divalent cation tolerance protein [Actinomycetospora succinea]|uniref:Periplasmic divalent cation tolerance protein n=1 Tax=Actinomycetospora succinea TaxID=663603 RepID=A0A4R6VE16_9PSEU|nr:divalent-cation tolerance protein CutA [Actinomycetospora succinea]TDQ61053.1 periplasmic divalent cation tolerance protein [Actinomycetospora succinea]
MTSDPTARVVLTTTDSADEAERLARVLVDAHLAACVQISGPVRSVFRWEGAVSVEPEWQLWLKTDAARVDDLTARLVAEHGYDVPEVLVLPVVGGHGPYLAWVTDETKREDTQDR